jgi:hypothetical protein
MSEEIQPYLNAIATGFITEADKDYICARSCYRMKLKHQFLWSTAQALEKYLKAILLFNGMKIKSYTHDIDKIFRAVIKIDNIDFHLPRNTVDFFYHIRKLGGFNRYHTETGHLIELDSKSNNGKNNILDRIDEAIARIRPFCLPCTKHPFYDKHETSYYTIASNFNSEDKLILNRKGYLFDVLKKTDSIEYINLVWNNNYFNNGTVLKTDDYRDWEIDCISFIDQYVHIQDKEEICKILKKYMKL